MRKGIRRRRSLNRPLWEKGRSRWFLAKEAHSLLKDAFGIDLLRKEGASKQQFTPVFQSNWLFFSNFYAQNSSVFIPGFSKGTPRVYGSQARLAWPRSLGGGYYGPLKLNRRKARIAQERKEKRRQRYLSVEELSRRKERSLSLCKAFVMTEVRGLKASLGPVSKALRRPWRCSEKSA